MLVNCACAHTGGSILVSAHLGCKNKNKTGPRFCLQRKLLSQNGKQYSKRAEICFVRSTYGDQCLSLVRIDPGLLSSFLQAAYRKPPSLASKKRPGRLPSGIRNKEQLLKNDHGTFGGRHLVSEPDPWKIEKEGLVNGAGWKCTLRNVRNYQLELSAEPDTHKSILIFLAWRLLLTKTKQNTMAALVQLAFLINAHQNAKIKSQSEVCLHTRLSVHFHPSPFTRPSFSIFRGSGSNIADSWLLQCYRR